MRRSLLALAVLFAASPARPGEKKVDPALLQGQWAFAAEVSGGVDVPAAKLKERKLFVKDNTYMFKSPVTGGERGTFTVDTTKDPPAIDLTLTDGPHKGELRRGIFTVAGDTLKVCLSPIGAERPTAFASARGSKAVLVTFRREKE